LEFRKRRSQRLCVKLDYFSNQFNKTRAIQHANIEEVGM
jgi:hypothetical protein